MVTRTRLPDLHQASICILDDQEANILLLRRLVARANCGSVVGFTSARLLWDYLTHSTPDLILLDLHMPEEDGFVVLQRLGTMIPESHLVPVLVLTADITSEAKEQALALGARDFLTKPFDATEALLRIGNLVEMRRLYVQFRDQNDDLERRVRERTRELENAQVEILDRLARAAEYRDDETGDHARRVGRIAGRVAAQLGFPADEVTTIERTAPLHDLGKLAIPDSILLKPGRLSPEEFVHMRTHASTGADLLAGGNFHLLRVAETIARSHHERWDGTGYPQGLAGEEIPLVARIVAVADVFDSLTHVRPYKHAWTVEEAAEELIRQRGLQFDSRVVDCLIQVLVADGRLAPRAGERG